MGKVKIKHMRGCCGVAGKGHVWGGIGLIWVFRLVLVNNGQLLFNVSGHLFHGFVIKKISMLFALNKRKEKYSVI